MKPEETKKLLNLVMNCLTEMWDRIEHQDPNKSTDQWRMYKCIRNNTRDEIQRIADKKCGGLV